MKELTPKQEKFCNEYMTNGGKASEAYREAYTCKNAKDTSVAVNASKLLSTTNIALRIKEMKQAISKRNNITEDDIMNRLIPIFESNIRDYVNIVTETHINDKGKEYEVQKVVYKDFKDLTENQLKAIESVRQGKTGIELKLHGFNWSAERICKMIGADAPTKAELTIGGKIDIQAIAHGQNNVEGITSRLPINMIIVGMVSAKANINPAEMMAQLASSYYSDYNGFGKTILDSSDIPLPGDIIRSANWEELGEKSKSNPCNKFSPIEDAIVIDGDKVNEVESKRSALLNLLSKEKG